MNFNDTLKRRLRGMAARIMSCIEKHADSDLDQLDDSEVIQLTGAELKDIRYEILNAAGDTTRSLSSLVEQDKPNTLSFGRDTIAAINKADIGFADTESGEVPVITLTGDFNLLIKIRNKIGSGVVYNNLYTCYGLHDIINHVMPFLDVAHLAGINIANGDYGSWRSQVCEIYTEVLENGNS